MKRITTGLLFALGYANAWSFEELNGLRGSNVNVVSAHPMAEPTVKSCGQAHCSEIGTVLTDTCKKNNWQEGHVVMLYHIEPKEVCYCSCPSTKFESENVKYFFSEEQARALAMDKNNFRPLSDEAAKNWTLDVLAYHKNFYPEVDFLLDWENDGVNANAGYRNGRRYIAIWGGMARHKAFKVEGISLVIAHELGHHYGEDGKRMACDGQADYIGARNIMRTVWFGENYVDVTRKAIAQVADSFNVADDPTIPNLPSAGCAHPPAKCRIATYYTALSLEHAKPVCAGN